ncbi:uncharacterized protein LOC125240355 [Leguminivora glycinivorella]|uniref:uncharacterized protein LOC125240355 n=1 Tax=Leguminivora glycinivorella TaxID=1035111 RepID=UPI00200C4264|nr:uncharacterized protein LOC125240355 [Leguminivora glycinivorella]
MAKSTVDALEKVIKKYMTPIETKIGSVLTELKKLEQKIIKIESAQQQCKKCRPCSPSDCSPNGSTTPQTRGENPVAATMPTVIANRNLPARSSVSANDRRTSLPAKVDKAEKTPVRIPDDDVVNENITPTPPIQVVDLNNSLHYKNNTPDPTQPPEDLCNEKWNIASYSKGRMRQKPTRVSITGTGPLDINLKTSERVKKLHTCFFKEDTTAEAIKSYITKKTGSTDCTVIKLQLKHNHYASFAITAPQSLFDSLMSAEMWPSGTEVSEWFRGGTGRARRARPSRRAPATSNTSAALSAQSIPRSHNYMSPQY